MNRRRVTMALLGVLAVGAAATASPRHHGEDLTPGQQADRSCRLLTRLQRQIAGNAAADKVLGTIADGRARAVDASRRDPVWLPLAGAWQALEKGFQTDDPEATRVGISAVRAGCDQSIDLPQPSP